MIINVAPIPIGFSGTREGLTPKQLQALYKWMKHRQSNFSVAHHGDCVGADSAFDMMLADFRIDTVLHPPADDALRAFCFRRHVYNAETHTGAIHRKVEELPPLDFLARNRAIVDACRALYAAPKTMREETRSGTWSTVRYARKQKRIIRVFMPDGTIRLS